VTLQEGRHGCIYCKSAYRPVRGGDVRVRDAAKHARKMREFLVAATGAAWQVFSGWQ